MNALNFLNEKYARKNVAVRMMTSSTTVLEWWMCVHTVKRWIIAPCLPVFLERGKAESHFNDVSRIDKQGVVK